MERFTVLVVVKNPNEDFGPKDLNLLHGECSGGRVAVDKSPEWWRLQCERYSVDTMVRVSANGTSALVKTVTDGESRNIEAAEHRPMDIVALRKS